MADAQARSVKSYLRRQQLEQQRQQIVMACGQTDQELLKLDGEIDTLAALMAEADRGE